MDDEQLDVIGAKYVQYRHQLLGPATLLSGSRAVAEEVVQDVFAPAIHQHPVDTAIDQLIEIARAHSGTPAAPRGEHPPERDPAADTWRSSFLRMPYARAGLARMSAIVETFETAITWDRLDSLHHDLTTELADVVRRVTGNDGLINCRITHVYPDGAAPYHTVIAAGRPGQEVEMWDEIKVASMEILTRHRATVTHHHAVGRDHRPGYDRQRTEVFATALTAAKHALDPSGMLNPGVLLPPRGTHRAWPSGL